MITIRKVADCLLDDQSRTEILLQISVADPYPNFKNRDLNSDWDPDPTHLLAIVNNNNILKCHTTYKRFFLQGK